MPLRISFSFLFKRENLNLSFTHSRFFVLALTICVLWFFLIADEYQNLICISRFFIIDICAITNFAGLPFISNTLADELTKVYRRRPLRAPFKCHIESEEICGHQK